MWQIYSPAAGGASGISIGKADALDPLEPRYWLRPGKQYSAARSADSVFDFYLNLKKHGRKEAALSLIVESVLPKDTQISPADAATAAGFSSETPTHALEVVNHQENKHIVVHRQGAEPLELVNGGRYSLKSGDRVQTYAGAESYIEIVWAPLHVYLRMVKKRDLEEIQKGCAMLGITFSVGTGIELPTKSHTHMIVPKLQREGTVPQFVAACYGMSIVHTAWLDALIAAGARQEDATRSKLEANWQAGWPDESDYFPPIEGKDSNEAEKEIWKPVRARHRLFQGCGFVDFSMDPNQQAMLLSGQAKYLKPAVASADALVPEIQAFRAANDIKKDDPVYLAVPLGGTVNTAAEAEMLNAAIQRTDIRAVIDTRDVMQAIQRVERITKVGGRVTGPATAVEGTLPAGTNPAGASGTAALPAPTATADISYPGTNPDDVHVPAPKRQQVEPPAEEVNRVNKKPRRLAGRGPVDIFEDLFADVTPVVSAANGGATQAPGTSQLRRGDTQGGSSMAMDGNTFGSGTSMPPPGQSRAQLPVRSDSKYANLKRRVRTDGAGTSQQDGSQPATQLAGSEYGFGDDAGDEDDEAAPPTKKFKSFDPDVESATSQVSERLRKQREAKEAEATAKALDGIAEEEDGADEGGTSQATSRKSQPKSKRTITDVVPDSEEENAAREATQKATKKRAAASAAPPASTATGKKPTKASLAAAAAAEQQKAAETQRARYLQVDTGKRRVNPAEAGFNEEFNRLKIKKPVAAESKRMGWNERDVFQEEMNERVGGDGDDDDDGRGDWKPDDNATFFQVKFVQMCRQPSAARAAKNAASRAIDPKYAGMPNFKAFRPKNSVQANGGAAAARQQRSQRADVPLVVHEPMGYGLSESYGRGNEDAARGHRARSNKKDEDSDDSVEMEMPMQGTNRAGNGTSKGKASQAKAKPKAGGKNSRKQAVESEEEEEEDELDQSSGSSRPASTARQPARTGRAAEAITIDSDSDEEDGKTFGGFNRSTATNRRRR